jgi:hypothetical protein
MSPARTLDQLTSGTEQYIHGAKAGRRNRLLAAALFSFCDAIRGSANSNSAMAAAARIAADTEAVVRLAHAPASDAFYAVWQSQREAIAEARTIIAKEGAAP